MVDGLNRHSSGALQLGDSYLLAKSIVSWSGGGMTKHTAGIKPSWPLAVLMFHLAF